uniref:NADH dehydrogenase subunit 6 n=1 Tax=Taiwanaptera montana TaxID=3135762 RepID=UPI0031F343C4
MNTIMTMITFMSMILPWTHHPMAMGCLMLVMTMMIAVMSGLLMKNFLMSYMLVMIMVSGLLVLFIYMASILPNSKFNLSMKMTSTMLLIALSTTMVEKEPLYKNTMKEIKDLSTLFNNNNHIMFMLITMLLIAMIIIAIIVNNQEGPLRKSY